MFWWLNNCWGSTLPKVMGKIQKAQAKISYRFCYKNALKYDFFTDLSQVSVIFIYYCLILLYFHDFELKQRKQILKISFQFSMGFHSKIYEILAWAFCIFPIILGMVDPQQRFDHQNTPNWSPQEFLIFLPKILAGSGENWKKRGESNFFQLVPMLKNEKNFFSFSMMWLYPVLFSINSRLQKCNLFACTPRMNNSRLSKQTKKANWTMFGWIAHWIAK